MRTRDEVGTVAERQLMHPVPRAFCARLHEFCYTMSCDIGTSVNVGGLLVAKVLACSKPSVHPSKHVITHSTWH